jgi:hypothetical protein
MFVAQSLVTGSGSLWHGLQMEGVGAWANLLAGKWMVVDALWRLPVFSNMVIKIRNLNTVGYKLQYPSVKTTYNVCICAHACICFCVCVCGGGGCSEVFQMQHLFTDILFIKITFSQLLYREFFIYAVTAHLHVPFSFQFLKLNFLVQKWKLEVFIWWWKQQEWSSWFHEESK